MTTNAARQPVDLDAFHPSVPAAKPKADPLAELARIVGQDDPFRALLEAQGSGPRAAQGRRIEPAFEVPLPPMGPAAAQAAPALRGGYAAEEAPADAFDRYLAEVERDSAAPAYDETMHAPEPAAERPRGRSRLMLVGGGLGICVVAVAGALTWKAMHGPHGAGSGSPVMVMADKAPLKVAPQDAGGVEIPDQNKQIYDRSALDGTAQNKVRIVNREEQPLDVQQIARETPAPAVGTGTSTSGAAAAAQPTNALTDSLGEPRRVRTVSVRPEQPPFARDGQRGADAASSAQQAAPPTMVLPQAAAGGAPQPAPASRPARTVQAAATPAVSAEPQATPAATPAAASPATAPSRPKPAPVQRVASAGADAETTASAAATPATSAAMGGFAVQLAVRPTEKEARAAFKQMQDRYADLGGRPALIRQAEINGKTIFRVRVGPLEREDANGLCTKLKGEGGQCFVAKN